MTLDCVAPNQQGRFVEQLRELANHFVIGPQGSNTPHPAQHHKKPSAKDIRDAKDFLEVIIAQVRKPTPSPFIFEDLHNKLEQLRDILNGEDPLKAKDCPY